MTHEQFEERKKEINKARKQKVTCHKTEMTETDMLMNYISARSGEKNKSADNT